MEKSSPIKLKSLLLFILKVSVSGTLMYVVLKRAGVENVISALKGIQPGAFVAALGIFIFILFLCSLRWRLLLPDRFAIGKVFSLVFMGSFFNTFLPGLVGGDVLKIYYLYRETGRGTQVFASVFMDRYMGYFAMMTMGLMAYPFGISYVKGTWISWALPVVVLAFYGVSIVLFWAKLGGGFRLLGELYGYFDSYRSRKLVLIKTFFISLLVHSLTVVIVYILSLGLEVPMPLAPLFVFVPIINTLSAMPVSVSGIGIREATMVLLFGTVGIGTEEATAISFAWFLIIVFGGLGGVFPYLKLKAGDRGDTVSSS